MTIPTAALEDGTLEKTILEAYDEIHRRVEQTESARLGVEAPEVYDGRPDGDSLGHLDAIAVFVHLDNVDSDNEAPLGGSYYFIGEWHIHVVVQDPDTERPGMDPETGIRAISGVVETFTETFDDVSLSGAVDDVELVDIGHEIASVAGGDERVAEWVLRLRIHHPLISSNRN